MTPVAASERVAAEFILTPREIDALVSTPLAGHPGVSITTLWQDDRDGSYAGLVRLEPGATVRAHTHRRSVHHVWVTHGRCIVADAVLGPGTYCFVPPGVEHAVEAAGDGGCTLFYLYQPGS